MQARAWRSASRACCVSFRLCAPFARVGQADGPVLGFERVDLEEAVALIAASGAVLNPRKGEGGRGGAHPALAGPLPAAVVVDGVDVPKTARQRALEQRLAGARGDVPPALGGPPGGILVADGDADAAARRVAELE